MTSAGDWTYVCPLDAIVADTGVGVDLDGQQVAVFGEGVECCRDPRLPLGERCVGPVPVAGVRRPYRMRGHVGIDPGQVGEDGSVDRGPYRRRRTDGVPAAVHEIARSTVHEGLGRGRDGAGEHVGPGRAGCENQVHASYCAGLSHVVASVAQNPGWFVALGSGYGSSRLTSPNSCHR